MEFNVGVPYTQTPNDLLELFPFMSPAEIQVVSVVARKTIGWKRWEEALSLSKLEELTRMSRQGVVNGVEAAMGRDHPILGRRPEGKGYAYFIIVENLAPALAQAREEAGLVNEVDQSTKRTSQRNGLALVNEVDQSAPPLVNEVDQFQSALKEKNGLKKDGKEKREGANDAPGSLPPQPEERSGGTDNATTYRQTDPPTPSSAPPLPSPEAIHIEIFGEPPLRTKKQRQRWEAFCEALGEVPDLGRWREACLAWSEARDGSGKPYNPYNAQGLLDWYRRGIARPNSRGSPARASPTAGPTPDQRAAYLAQVAKLNGEQHEHGSNRETGT